MSSSDAPIGFTKPQLDAEQAWLAGAIVTGTGYGVVAALSWLCLRALWYRLQSRRETSRRRNLCFLIYVCALFVFGTLFLASNSQFTQLAFINNRDYAGGPSAYEEQMFSIGVDEIGNVSYVLANWLADSLLVWRCVIIYRDFDVSWRLVLLVTGLMQLSSYVIGTFFLLQISSPASSPYFNADHPVNWTFPYFCVSLAINITVTLLISIRLLLYRRHMDRLLGPGHATECTTVVAMLVESAALFASFSLLFLVPYAIGSGVSYTFLQVLGEAQLIAPLLIIYREAQGKGWISSASSVASSTMNDRDRDRDLRFGVGFSDIEFATDGIRTGPTNSMPYARTLEVKSKTETGTGYGVGLGEDSRIRVEIEEVRREEEVGVELREL